MHFGFLSVSEGHSEFQWIKAIVRLFVILIYILKQKTKGYHDDGSSGNITLTRTGVEKNAGLYAVLLIANTFNESAPSLS